MSPTGTQSPADLFAAESLVAFVSDRAVDFALPPGGALTDAQRTDLSVKLGGCGTAVVNIRQVHGDRIITADVRSLSEDSVPEADAVVTRSPGVPTAVRTADCLPVFLFDPVRRCIGIAHAGWKGSRSGVAAKTLDVMIRQWGCRPSDLRAAFGPCIRPCCYEVGPEFRESFPDDLVVRHGSLYMDLAAVNRKQLLASGMDKSRIADSEICTCCSPGYFSFRREGQKAGRHLSLIMLTPSRF
ncbi:MAG: peptidoglycan editing factor PgeF [Candidatus Omnitrophota bacterium]|nr:peptidoglycan editing factor PgeF [Candidatus Omnitrophota bacterium]